MCNLVKYESLLEWLSEQPMASVLFEELKTVALNSKGIEYAEGASWATLAVEEDLQGRGRGTQLVAAGAERGRGGGKGREGKGEC